MDAWRGPEVPDLPGRGPEPRLRDTATGELTVAATGRDASLYACGITPYDATHLGHAATFTAWDLLVRAWLDAGHHVTYTQNVTDVDDPLLERAERDGVDWRELALRETERYRRDMEALRIVPPAHLIGAVEAVPLIDRFAERLAARGSLYDLEGDTYFARCADPAFGALSGPDSAPGLSLAQMTALSAERGGDPDRPGKKDPLDVLVWRAERPGEPAWDSRFGPGRPGWHVECAAIAVEFLGEAFDVQAGGSDLVFPHHEMSASHARVACAADGRVFARVYAHSGMVAYQGQKMSKSLGNLVFVSKLRDSGVDPMAIRLAILAHHYRSDWEWTPEVLAAATARLTRWRTAVSSAHPPRRLSPGPARARGGRRPAHGPRTPRRRPGRPGRARRDRRLGRRGTGRPGIGPPRRRPPHPRHSRRPPGRSPVVLKIRPLCGVESSAPTENRLPSLPLTLETCGRLAIPSPSVFVKEHFCDVVDFAGVIHSQKIKSPRRIDSAHAWLYDTRSLRGHFVPAARSGDASRDAHDQGSRDQDTRHRDARDRDARHDRVHRHEALATEGTGPEGEVTGASRPRRGGASAVRNRKPAGAPASRRTRGRSRSAGSGSGRLRRCWRWCPCCSGSSPATAWS